MKKIFIIMLAFILILSGCSSEEKWDYRPMTYFNNTFYYDTNTVLSKIPEGFLKTAEVKLRVDSSERPPEENCASNFCNVGTPIYTNPHSPEIIYMEFEENKFLKCELPDEKKSISSSSIAKEESLKSEYSSQSESSAESSGYENPYTSCVPEWSVSSPEPDSSYVHSTDTSSNISAESHTSQSGITSSSLPEYTSSP